LEAPALVSQLPEVDRLAERMLRRAERLTANLEIVGFAAALHVINVSGRQRMLSQRVAKAALMSALLNGKAAVAAMQAAKAELVEGFAYLDALPLSNAEIGGELSRATQVWERLQAALEQVGTQAGQEAIAVLSEVLLAQFDRLTDDLERGMQALIR
jgi:Type IV pili methyl-accepting chemotaxis transducer N-term